MTSCSMPFDHIDQINVCVCVSVCVSYQQVDHVWFVVSQRLDGVKDVDAALLS